MAYTNGIFRIDLVSGSDAARTALTSCTASNPSGSITRINKTAHGLVTGAVVDTTLFTAWLNGAFKITVVDADNFDLDDTVWQATADTSGTVTPRGGSSWSDAFLTLPSSARIQPGDEQRVAKTADPVSTGVNATFTQGSKTVTLASALTKTIENASAADWTVSANITQGTNSNRKIGATALLLTPGTAFTTGKVAYKELGSTQDFSGYTKISFFFRQTAGSIVTANTYKICLCSDTTGDTIVNEINIPATTLVTAFHIFTLDYGGALGASIQSVAIYANSDPGTNAISINNIIACNDFTHQTLFGKNNEVWFNVQSIDETALVIDSNSTAITGNGYHGSTSTETLYYAVPVYATTTTSFLSTSENGASTSPRSTVSGGWDTTSDTKTSVTRIASNVIGTGNAISMNTFYTISDFVIARFSTATTNPAMLTWDNMVVCGGNAQLGSTSESRQFFKNSKFLNLAAAVATASSTYTFENCLFANSLAFSVQGYGRSKFLNCEFRNNVGGSIQGNGGSITNEMGAILLRNCILTDSTEVSLSGDQLFWIWSLNHDQTAGNHWGFTGGATVNWQTTTKQGADPGSWKVTTTSSNRGQYLPIEFKLAEAVVAASALVTVKVWVKKDHATNIAASIYVEDALYSLPGITLTTATKASDTNWEQLTITFTPTSAGVVRIFGSAWYVAGNSNAYFGSVEITQA
jgi:hypothetical protein